MSAKSAVTVLRSPSIAVDPSGCSDVTRISGAVYAVSDDRTEAVFELPTRAAPQSPQNFSPGSLPAPHAGQTSLSGWPNWTQNLRALTIIGPARAATHWSPPSESHGPRLLYHLPSRVDQQAGYRANAGTTRWDPARWDPFWKGPDFVFALPSCASSPARLSKRIFGGAGRSKHAFRMVRDPLSPWPFGRSASRICR